MRKTSMRAAMVRGIGFFGFWLLLIGPKPVDLAAGLFAAAAATWARKSRISAPRWPASPASMRLPALQKRRSSISLPWRTTWRLTSKVVGQGTRITSRQRQRMAEGRIESSPAEYGAGPSEDAASLREARRKIEERRWMKELGLLD